LISLCALASGSNGNCYYIGNEHEAVLIDAGIPARRIITRMKVKGLLPARVRAIFVSHEHADHASGARVIARRLNIPVYVTQSTYLAMYANHKPDSPRFFKPGQEITLGSFVVHTFFKNHDAAEPCSFCVDHKGIRVGIFTDMGSPSEHVITHLGQCHALFLETNYDEKMLWEGSYPQVLKQRIASDHGHLSNDQAFELLKNYAGEQLKAVFLSHLSAENNRPELASGRFEELSARYNIYLTSRQEPGEVVRIQEEVIK